MSAGSHRHQAPSASAAVRPSSAERARTSVASACTGALVTYPRYGSPVLATVSVRAGGSGLVFSLTEGNPATRVLGVRPLATVRVAPAGCELTSLQGAVHGLPRVEGSRLVEFALDIGAVRLGPRWSEVVDLDDYRAAEPDPLRADAPAILAHLRRDHGPDLTDCLRAQGHTQARWVQAHSLDRYGLELSVLDDDGVARVRLDFPNAVGSLEDLGPGLYVALRGRCADCRTPSPDQT